MQPTFAVLQLVSTYLDKDDLVKMIFVNKEWSSVISWDTMQNLRLHAAIKYGKQWTFDGELKLPDTYMVVLDKHNHRILYNGFTVEEDLNHTMVSEIYIVEENKSDEDNFVIEDDCMNCIYASCDTRVQRIPAATFFKWFGHGPHSTQPEKFGHWRLLEKKET